MAKIGATSSGYTNSLNAVDWWSAQNFCKAIGKHSVRDVKSKCTSEEWAVIQKNKYGTCAGWKTGANMYGWTAALQNACNGYYVSLAYGSVSSTYRIYDGSTALCE